MDLDMVQNRRRTHVNVLYRFHDDLDGSAFMEMDELTLRVKMELHDKAYASFVEEHQTYVSYVTSDQFESNDEFFGQIEATYQATVIAMRKRLNELETMNYVKHCAVVNNTVEPLNVRNEKQQQQHRKSEVVIPSTSKGSLNDLRQKLKPKKKARQIITKKVKKILSCHNCGRSHKMFKCGDFLKRSIDERMVRVQQLKLCRNCFFPKTGTQHQCASGPCRRWGTGARHNSLLCKKE